MFRISRHRHCLTQIDLSTLRQTLRYMKTDADRVPGLEKVARALHVTLEEVDRAERRLTPPDLSPSIAKFLPTRRK